MGKAKFREHLMIIGACRNAWEWAGERTAEQAWEDCEHSMVAERESRQEFT